MWAAFVIAVGMAGAARAEAPAEALVERYGKAVVTITVTTVDGQARLGTGFFVTPEGRLITNLHVIRGAEKVVVRKTDGTSFDAVEVMAHDLPQDYAILKVATSRQPTVLLGDSDLPKIGARVYVIGNPQGLENTVTDGLLSGRRMLKEGVPLLQISAPISTGSSGSPVFDAEGRVIGVAVSRVVDGQNLNFAIPINSLKGELTRTAGRTLSELDATVALEEALAALNEDDLDQATELYEKVARSPHDPRTRRLAASLALSLISARIAANCEAYDLLKKAVELPLPDKDDKLAPPDVPRHREAYRRLLQAIQRRCLSDLDAMTRLYLDCQDVLDREPAALTFRLGRPFEAEALAVEQAHVRIAEGVLNQTPFAGGLGEAAFYLRARHKHAWLQSLGMETAFLGNIREWPRLPRLLQTRALIIPPTLPFGVLTDAVSAQIVAHPDLGDTPAFNRLVNERYIRIKELHESRRKPTTPATNTTPK